jgi:2-dehydro-3-deoxygluconokinase
MVDGKFLAFGELLVRLSPPPPELLLQRPALTAWLAGAEANVATALAKLGHQVAFVSQVPDNDLGRWAVATLRSHGVDTTAVALGGQRMGLYFVTLGAGARATDVLYDREGSAFATAPAAQWNWDELLEGVGHLHLTGITLALGSEPAEAAIAAASAAAARGIRVSFDGNWRGKLWARWDGNPKAYLRQVMTSVDILFGNRRDLGLMLGRDFPEPDMGMRAAASAAFDEFPRLTMIASTERDIVSSDVHDFAARIDCRDRFVETGKVRIERIVDRVGSGDAFVAGVLHALLGGGDVDVAVGTGVALAVLKHSLPGDAALFSQRDIDAFQAGERDIRR